MYSINTNIPALSAADSLDTINRRLNVLMRQLSTGVRAVDAETSDANYGLSVMFTTRSEGLAQAIANANTGINFLNIMSAATTESTELLRKMRTLCVQSRNGGYGKEDRAQMDAVFQQLKADLDRNAKSTTFNGASLINGGAGGGAADTSKPAVAESGFLIRNTQLQKDVTLKITITGKDESGKEQSIVAKDTQLLIKKEDFNKVHTIKEQIDLINKIIDNDKILGGNLRAGVSEQGYLTLVSAARGKDITIMVQGNAAEDDLFFSSASPVTGMGSGTQPPQPKPAVAEATVAAQPIPDTDMGKLDITLNDKTTSITITASGSSMAVADIPAALKAAIKGTALENEFSDIKLLTDSKLNFLEFTTTKKGADVSLSIKDAGAASKQYLLGNGTAITGKGKGGNAGGAGGGTVVFHIGAGCTEENNSISIDSYDLTEQGLGVTGLDIKSPEAASESCEKVEEALVLINRANTEFGAVAGRLGYAVRNLGVVKLNTDRALAYMRDTDYAQATTALAREKILQQAASAMLTQANQSPQMVLQLLRS